MTAPMIRITPVRSAALPDVLLTTGRTGVRSERESQDRRDGAAAPAMHEPALERWHGVDGWRA
jgi:hypothetical protein